MVSRLNQRQGTELSFSERLHRVIPGGCHTYSRGDDQFPSNAPQILSKGSGAYVYTSDHKSYLDYGMGLRAVACGYHQPAITHAAMDNAMSGNCLTRPSMIELEAAELACDLLGFDMVKFTKTGSAATTAAVKLARAATGRRIILRANQPFFSYDDWCIRTTSRHRGCDYPKHLTKVFDSVEELRKLILSCRPAAVIMEPKDYDLKAVRELCTKYGVILIFDEMITGFRYHLKGKQHLEGIKPDLSCFGKAMANGFSVACVGGKREIMELGAQHDMFLLSTTHGAEMCGLGAFVATVEFMQKNNVIQHLWHYGKAFREMVEKCKLSACMGNPKLTGDDCNMALQFSNSHAKTLFLQEMMRRGVMMPWLAFSYSHGDKELELTRQAIEGSMNAIAAGAKLEGPEIRPVFN